MKEQKQQFNVYLTPGTVKQMKHRSVDMQLSLSDLVEQVFTAYLAQAAEQEGVKLTQNEMQEKAALKLQPMLHVEDMGKAVDFYTRLGATILNGSRDGDWVLLRIGGAELGLLAHPANPEQNEGKVELNFEYAGSLQDLEEEFRIAKLTVVRPTGDEGFGYQLQIEDADGMLIKINQLDPELYR